MNNEETRGRRPEANNAGHQTSKSARVGWHTLRMLDARRQQSKAQNTPLGHTSTRPLFTYENNKTNTLQT